MSYTFIIGAFKVLIPIIVIGLNVAIKTITILLVKWIGYETKSQEISKIQSIVFLLTFWNSAISILLINTNFGDPNKPDQQGFLSFLFNGKFTDFSDEWFNEISFFFVSPMFLQTIYPLF